MKTNELRYFIGDFMIFKKLSENPWTNSFQNILGMHEPLDKRPEKLRICSAAAGRPEEE